MAALALLACTIGCDRGSIDERAHVTPPRAERAGAETQSFKGDLFQLVRTLDMLAAAYTDPEELTTWAFDIQSGKRTMDQFIDKLVDSRGLGLEVAPSLIFGMYLSIHNYYVLPTGYNLMQTEPDEEGRVINYIRAPCSPDEAVTVQPWWDLDSEVLVCPDTYRPGKWTIEPDEHQYKTRVPIVCDSQVGSPEKEIKSICGCGPNLIRCMPSMDRFLDYHASLKNEIRQSTAYVIANDMPLDTLFLSNETYRDHKVERLYRRRTIGALKIADVPSMLADIDEWPEYGQWAPRPELRPGEQSGVLTTPQLLNWLPDRRQRTRQFFEILWCQGRNSFGATTEKVFELNDSANLSFVQEGWERLAHTELCSSCHARLDYGFQFWLGYPDPRASTHFVPELQAEGEGPFYAQDIDDLRGKGPLTPHSFTKLALAQPEYKECMSGHVINYVLGDHATAEDRAAIGAAFAERHSFKQAMRVAFARYAARWLAQEPAPARTRESGAHVASKSGGVVIGSELRALLDQHCIDCHDDVPFVDSSVSYGRPFDMTGSELARELVVRMADHVAYRKMPRDVDDFTDAQRIDMVELFIDALWPDEDARREARAYYLDHMRPMPAHQVDVALELIKNAAGQDPQIGWGLLERAIYSDQALMTPAFVAVTALEALYACGGAGGAGNTAAPGSAGGASVVRCLERALSSSRLTRWPE